MTAPIEDRIARIPGFFTFRALYDEAVENARDGDVFVEIGVYCGRSLAYLARRVIDSGKDIRIYAVDPWEHAADPATWESARLVGESAEPVPRDVVAALGGPFSAFLHFMTAHAPEELERVHVLRTLSSAASRLFEPASCGLVFVDGDHSYAGCLADIDLYESKVRRGGILAGDDYRASTMTGVKRAVDAYAQDTTGKLSIEGTTWKVRL